MATQGHDADQARNGYRARLGAGFRELRFRDVATQTPPAEVAEIGRRVAALDREGRREEEPEPGGTPGEA